jgi:phage gpG-like protein
MSQLVTIDFKMPDYFEIFKKSLKRIQISIAADIQTSRGLIFDGEGQYQDHQKWADLKSGLNLKKEKNGLQTRQILRKTGALKNSLSPSTPSGKAGPDGYVRLEGDIKTPVVAVGTNLKYARIHDQGGTIKHPGTSNGFGRGIKIPAHKIEMPKRNFSDWTRDDEANMQKMLLTDILNGG